MAKLKMPLMSAEARGALAKSLVFFPWKGVNAVREYVIPTNPRSDDQVAQRNKLTAAVAEYHAAGYTALDLTAFSRLASVMGKAMTAFNTMCKLHIDEAILGNTWERISDCLVSVVTTTSFDVNIKKAEGGNNPYVHYGTRDTYMPNSQIMGPDGVDRWLVTISGLLPNTKYYFWFDVGTSGTDYGRTGIYTQKTKVA